jgi:hypothetical protein
MKKIFLILLLSSCGKPDILIEPDGCKEDPNIPTYESKELCISSLRCVEDNHVIYNEYFCVCSGPCLCFFAIMDGCNTSDCEKLGGGMFIFPGDFCLLPNKKELLLEMNRTIDRMEQESI